jgi:hypothetical protein
MGGLNDEGEAVILFSNYNAEKRKYKIQFENLKQDLFYLCEQYLLDSDHDLELISTEKISSENNILNVFIDKHSVLMLKMGL